MKKWQKIQFGGTSYIRKLPKTTLEYPESSFLKNQKDLAILIGVPFYQGSRTFEEL